jgi:hypothetical protein
MDIVAEQMKFSAQPGYRNMYTSGVKERLFVKVTKKATLHYFEVESNLRNTEYGFNKHVHEN